MSQAHRPTWRPAMGKETKSGSRVVGKLDLPSYTKLKFRQPGQTTVGELQRRDFKAELAEAERKATDKKRKAAGLPPLPPPQTNDDVLRIAAAERVEREENEEKAKRQKLAEDGADIDRDDDDEDDPVDGDAKENGTDKGKGKAAANDDDDDEDESEDESDDDEDETAALMAELAKIKAERAEEKAKLDAEAANAAAIDREHEIATGNPLINLQAALGQTPGTPGSSTTGSFAVKRRWDDDLVFRNQAANVSDKPSKEFVNDLLRSEFHRKFMLKFIK